MFIKRNGINENVNNELDEATAELRVNEIGSSANQISSFASAGTAHSHMCWSDKNKVPAGFLRLSKWMETTDDSGMKKA